MKKSELRNIIRKTIQEQFNAPDLDTSSIPEGTLYPGSWTPSSWNDEFVNRAWVEGWDVGCPTVWIAQRYNILYPKYTPASRGPKWLNMLSYKLVGIHTLLTAVDDTNSAINDFCTNAYNLGNIDPGSEDVPDAPACTDPEAINYVPANSPGIYTDNTLCNYNEEPISEKRLDNSDNTKALSNPPTAEMRNRLGSDAMQDIQKLTNLWVKKSKREISKLPKKTNPKIK